MMDDNVPTSCAECGNFLPREGMDFVFDGDCGLTGPNTKHPEIIGRRRDGKVAILGWRRSPPSWCPLRDAATEETAWSRMMAL